MKTNSPSEAEVIIQKLPSDMGIHRNPRKGTLDAPEKILEGLEFDRSVLVEEVFPDEFDLEETHDRIYENTLELADFDRPIVSLGGDHSVSYPVFKALKQQNPGMKLVWLDAHLDIKEKVDGHVSHDVVVRQLVEEGLFEPEEIYFVGITEIDHDEEGFLEEHDFNFYRPEELDDFIAEFEGMSYLSIDIDVLQEELAPGTGYPDGKLDLQQVLEVVEAVEPVHADIVEVAPCLDHKGKTVEASRKVLERIIPNTSQD
ncbi:MAG: arginase family protein [Candidatus Nanohaloarchaea archaeon]